MDLTQALFAVNHPVVFNEPSTTDPHMAVFDRLSVAAADVQPDNAKLVIVVQVLAVSPQDQWLTAAEVVDRAAALPVHVNLAHVDPAEDSAEDRAEHSEACYLAGHH